MSRLNDFCVPCDKWVSDLAEHVCPKIPKRAGASRSGTSPAFEAGDAGSIPAAPTISVPGSSNGRTAVSEAANGGSIPPPGSTLPARFGRSWSEHIEAWHEAGSLFERALWTRAAVAFSLRETFHAEGIEKFADEVKQTPARIYQLAQVFEAFPAESNRFESLSFTHHQLAAGTKDPGSTLQEAVAQGWSVPKMRKALAPAEPSAAASLVDAAEARQQAKGAAPAPERQPQTNDVRDIYALVRFIIRNYERDEIDRLCGLLSNAEAAA